MPLKKIIDRLLLVLVLVLMGFHLVKLEAPVVSSSTNTDVLNRPIEMPEQPQRIFLGFYFNSYLAINGSFERVAALPKEAWKNASLAQYELLLNHHPDIEGIFDPGDIDENTFRIDELLNLKPDLCVLAPFQFEVMKEEVRLLEAMGIPVVVIDFHSVDHERYIKSIELLGKMGGHEKRAKAFVDFYRERMALLDRRLPKEEPLRKRVYIELANTDGKALGQTYGDYMWGALVEKCGGMNVAKDDIADFGFLDEERLFYGSIDAMILVGNLWSEMKPYSVSMGPGVREAEVLDEMANYLSRNPTLTTLEEVYHPLELGVYHGHLRSVFQPYYMSFIAKALYPDLFQDLQPEEELRACYREYYPLPYDGAYMVIGGRP